MKAGKKSYIYLEKRAFWAELQRPVSGSIFIDLEKQQAVIAGERELVRARKLK